MLLIPIYIYINRWWKHIGIAEKMKFARDRLVENAFWNVGMISEPQFGYCRERITKLFKLISVMDDTYDVYGTMDELELFTTAIERSGSYAL